MTKIIVSILLSLLLAACGNELTYSENDSSILQEKFFVIIDSSEAIEVANEENIFVKSNSKNLLYSEAFQNNEYIGESNLSEYYFLRLWKVGGNSITNEHWGFSAQDKPYEICHLSIDIFGDSLQTCFNIFKDTPISISLLEPAQSENGIKKNTRTSFFAKVDGIDTLEQATCDLFISEKRDDLWQHLHTSNFICNDTLLIDIGNADLYYWGIRAFTQNQTASDSAYSEIFEFYTAPTDGKAYVTLPIRYEGDRGFEKKGFVKIFQDSILLQQFQISGDTTLILRDLPENKILKLTVEETIRLDYKKDSMEFVVAPAVHNALPTLTIKDKNAPEAFPLRSTFAIDDSICFYAAENGSGINALRSAIILTDANDSLKYKYNGSRFIFSVDCESSCYVEIHLEDNAGNVSPQKRWKLEYGIDSITVSGPISL